MDVNRLRRKLRAIVRKGPSTLRNLVYSRLGIWPVGHIDGCDLQSIPTYCISLPRATKKRGIIQGQVRKLGLKQFEFIDAVDAQELDREQLIESGLLDDTMTLEFHDKILTMNEVACSLSHAAAYERVVERKHPVALILEDDALFISRRVRRFRLEDVPPDFDCIFLNTFLSDEPPKDRVRGPIYEDTSYAGSAAAYLLSATGAAKLAVACIPVVHAADGLLGRSMELRGGEEHPFRQHGATTSIRTYIVYPDCVLNGSVSYYFVSDVQGP